MKRLAGFIAVGSLFTMIATVSAQDVKTGNCPEDLEVIKLVYATSRGNAELYLETLARTDMKLKAVQTQLDAAMKKIKQLEEPKSEVVK